MVKRSVDQLLDDARERIERVTPAQARDLVARGALLIDIRPAAQRAQYGEAADSLIVERNVLEWRFDPQSPWRIGEVAGYERPLLVLCQEGYASSFAADSLRALGHGSVADVIGGFAAWRAAGLPVRSEGAQNDAGLRPA
jgi:rhodanese-related sulfurtransferase